jgi:uncharacterized protein YndB with AHSA1/START domain
VQPHRCDKIGGVPDPCHHPQPSPPAPPPPADGTAERAASVRRTIDLDCSVDELWHLVTDAAGLGEWLGRGVQLDLRPGGRGRLQDDDGSVRELFVREVVDGRRFGFAWWGDDDAGATEVTFAIEPTDRDGSRLTVTETQPAGMPWSTSRYTGDRPTASTASTSAGGAAPSTGSWDLRLLSLWLSVCALARV